MKTLYYKLIERKGYLEYHVSIDPREVKCNQALSKRITLQAKKEMKDAFKEEIKREADLFGMIEIKEL